MRIYDYETVMTYGDVANQISWSFGNCDSDYEYIDSDNDDVYDNNRIYNQRCCFKTSTNNWVFPLVCESKAGLGWDDGYITIGGKRYCDDFLDGYEKTVYVEANPS